MVTEDFEIQGFADDKILVKKGDKGFVDSNGFVHYETGNARGKMQKFKDIELEGYDTENIAKLILDELKWKFNFGEFLEDYDCEEKNVVDEIDCVLSEIF